MNAIHIAAFVMILTAVMNVTTTVLDSGMTYSDQDLYGRTQDYVENASYPYQSLPEGQRGVTLGEGDWIGGFWGFMSTVTVGMVLPYNTFLQLAGCGLGCGPEIEMIALMFTGIVYFIYGLALFQFFSGRAFKGME